jgi:hypothetical protein
MSRKRKVVDEPRSLNNNFVPPNKFLNHIIFYIAAGLVISKLNSIGRLTAELTYDDVGYASEGANLYKMFSDGGPLTVLHSLIRYPPHAPVETILAFLSNFAYVASPATIYILNALIVGFLLFRLQGKIFGVQNLVGKFIAAVIWVGPLGIYMSSSFRPDVLFALLAGILIISFQELVQTENLDVQRIESLKVGALIAFLLYVKPTFIFYTFIIFIFIIINLILHKFFFKKENPFSQGIFVRVFGISAILSIPFLLIFFRQTYAYVIANTVGVNSSVWTYPRFYAVKWVLLTCISISGPLLLSIAVFAFVFLFLKAWLNKDSRLAQIFCLYTLLISACAIPLYFAATLNAWFGLTPVMILIAAGSVGIKEVLETMTRSSKLNAIGIWAKSRGGVLNTNSIVLLCLLFVWMTPPHFAIAKNLQNPYRYNTRILEAIVKDCQKNLVCENDSLKNGETPRSLVAVVGDEVSPDSLAWLANETGWSPQIGRLDDKLNMADILNYIEGFQYLIFAKPNISGVNWKIPVNNSQQEILGKLQNSSQWQEIYLPLAGSDYVILKKLM